MAVQPGDHIADGDIVGGFGDGTVQVFEKAGAALLHGALLGGRVTVQSPNPISDPDLHLMNTEGGIAGWWIV
jgi:hypothetical protein